MDTSQQPRADQKRTRLWNVGLIAIMLLTYGATRLVSGGAALVVGALGLAAIVVLGFIAFAGD